MNLKRWIQHHARPVGLNTDAPPDDLTELDDIVKDATVVGLGETTRASREIMHLSLRVLRYLVEHKGFDTLAIDDDESVWAELNDWTRTRHGDPAAILAHAWAPWRTRETLQIIDWIADHNHAHPDAPVTIVGLGPTVARTSDYDLVTAHVASHAPESLAALRGHYDTIRTAHDVNEHVQTAQGVHPGRPFAAHARDALDLVTAATDDPGVVAAAQRIHDFHATSIAAGGDVTSGARHTFEAIRERVDVRGAKVIYWEGMAHTAKRGGGVAAMDKQVEGVGALLHAAYGPAYVALLIGFDSGEIHAGVRIPAPPAEFSDAVFAAGPSPYLLDTHAPADDEVRAWLAGEHRLRIIAGIYRPEHDGDHYFVITDLPGNFDAMLRVGAITPTRLLR